MKIIAALLLFATSLFASASVPFNGLILDSNGKPIKGVKVYVHNPKNYSKTDKEGRFGLTDVKPTDTLRFTLKKVKYEVPVNGAKSMYITVRDLSAHGSEDQELINMGAGFVKKREYLGPVGGVTHEQLMATGESDLIRAMTGLVPGVRVVEYSDGFNLSIRNSISFHSSTKPLWIVDGVQSMTPPSLTVLEVERVEILKDGAGYGTRGANGVVIVTLKNK